MQTIICDSREQKNAHILAYFGRQGIPYKVRKMDVADYQIEGDDSIVIDRKQNLDELCRNLTNKSDRSRFWKEIRRAHDKKIRMIVLCEHGCGIRCIEDVKNWSSRYSPVSGRVLMEKIYQCHIAYQVEFLFCDNTETAEMIIKLLNQQICTNSA
jgi:ERCC4-type nuclease